jgi:hypothetical protein
MLPETFVVLEISPNLFSTSIANSTVATFLSIDGPFSVGKVHVVFFPLHPWPPLFQIRIRATFLVGLSRPSAGLPHLFRERHSRICWWAGLFSGPTGDL